MGELRSRLEKHFGFTRGEVVDLLSMSLVGGVVFSFRQWGPGATPDIGIGLRNLFIATLIVLFSMLIHVSIQRVLALKEGYKASFKVSYPWLFFSLLIAIISRGTLPVFFPGMMRLAHIPRLRIGEFRYGISYQDNAWIAAKGVLSHLALALAFSILFTLAENDVFMQIILINVVIAVCTILPFPSLEGMNIFYSGRVTYAALFFGVVGTALFIFFANPLVTVFLGIVCAIAGALWYWFKVEAKT